ncbi:hypothetical protein GQ602_002826 [Ophiocordyceps camponoti-floridani]|uniref:Uncharacterized protein n=1 Tax=Ophiocordyceps camponoti-floridani TaxID=2030778 RepID=A0A8H4VFS1_9HYPO|nr:hypothetical protein GQ602_002826 [Ophiocordyceps camponoti-floridani]
MWEVHLETGVINLNGTYQQLQRQLQERGLAGKTGKSVDEQAKMTGSRQSIDRIMKPHYFPNPSCGPWQKANTTAALKAVTDINDIEDYIVPFAGLRGQECVRYSCVDYASVWMCNTNPVTSTPRSFIWSYLPQKAMQIFKVCSWPDEPRIAGRINEMGGLNAKFTTAILRQKCDT